MLRWVPVSARLLVVLATFSLSLSGCGKNEAQEASGMPSAPPASVRIGYFANATHAQAVLEVASGDLAKALAPSQLTSRVFNAGPSLVEALFGGEIDLGYLGPGPAINAFVKSHGQGIRVIAGAAANGVLIVARPDAGINTLADLKGKRIATPQVGNTQDISCRHYMTQVLHQSDLGNVLPVSNAEQAAMMARGQIDAAWSPEPWGSRLVQETGAKVIAHEKDLWPERQFTLTVVVTTPQFLQEHPDIVEKMLKVHRTWTARLQQEPDRYVAQLDDALAALTGKRLPKGILPAALANIQFTDEPLEPTLKTFSQWTYDLGFSRRQADLADLTDLTILHRLEKSGRSPTAEQSASSATTQNTPTAR